MPNNMVFVQKFIFKNKQRKRFRICLKTAPDISQEQIRATWGHYVVSSILPVSTDIIPLMAGNILHVALGIPQCLCSFLYFDVQFVNPTVMLPLQCLL